MHPHQQAMQIRKTMRQLHKEFSKLPQPIRDKHWGRFQDLINQLNVTVLFLEAKPKPPSIWARLRQWFARGGYE